MNAVVKVTFFLFLLCVCVLGGGGGLVAVVNYCILKLQCTNKMIMVKNIKSKFSCLQEYVNHHVISV